MTYHSTGIRLNESCKKWFRILNHKQNYGLGILMVFERRLIYCLTSREMDVTPITLALSGAAAYPRACQALSSMLSKNALNPADITIVIMSIYRVEWSSVYCFIAWYKIVQIYNKYNKYFCIQYRIKLKKWYSSIVRI